MYDVYQFKNKNMQIWRYGGEIKKLLRYDVRNLKGSVCVRALIFKIFVYNIYARGAYIFYFTHTVYFILRVYIRRAYVYKICFILNICLVYHIHILFQFSYIILYYFIKYSRYTHLPIYIYIYIDYWYFRL